MKVDRRRSAFVRFRSIVESVIKSCPQPVINFFAAIDWDRVAQVELEQSQVVKSHHVICVLVRVNHRVRDADPFTNQLSPQIGRGVDQQVPFRQTQNRAGSRSFITRMVASASIAAAADGGDSNRGACAQQNQLAGDVGRERLFFQSFGRSWNRGRVFVAALLSSIHWIWARNGGRPFFQE